MCKYFLGCFRVDTRKSQDNGMTQHFTRFPPVSPLREFWASSACKLERERERELDAREAPNGKSGGIFGIYNPYHTCTHMVCPLPFGAIPMLRSPSTAKPYPRWSGAKLIAHIVDRRPEEGRKV